jgi:hypothetical protein
MNFNEPLVSRQLHIRNPKSPQEKEVCAWTWDTVNHTKVLDQALATGFASDVVLSIGKDEEKEEVRAHRVILSIYSPVLQKVIKNSPNVLHIHSSIDPTHFKMLLRVSNNV